MAKEYLVKRLAAWTAHEDLQQADRDGWLLITIDGGVAYFSRDAVQAKPPPLATPKQEPPAGKHR